MSNSERAALTALACVAIWTFIGLPIIYHPAEHSEGIKPGEWLVGGATIALFVSTLALWWATRRLVLGAEDTAKRQLRAYLAIETYSIWQDADAIRCSLRVINAGQTPAYDLYVKNYIYLHYGSDSEFDHPPVTFTNNKTVSLPPKITLYAATKADASPRDLIAFEDEEATAFLVGSIGYRDVYGEQHRLNYRGKAVKQPDGWRFQASSVGNDQY